MIGWSQAPWHVYVMCHHCHAKYFDLSVMIWQLYVYELIQQYLKLYVWPVHAPFLWTPLYYVTHSTRSPFPLLCVCDWCVYNNDYEFKSWLYVLCYIVSADGNNYRSNKALFPSVPTILMSEGKQKKSGAFCRKLKKARVDEESELLSVSVKKRVWKNFTTLKFSLPCPQLIQ